MHRNYWFFNAGPSSLDFSLKMISLTRAGDLSGSKIIKVQPNWKAPLFCIIVRLKLGPLGFLLFFSRCVRPETWLVLTRLDPVRRIKLYKTLLFSFLTKILPPLRGMWHVFFFFFLFGAFHSTWHISFL